MVVNMENILFYFEKVFKGIYSMLGLSWEFVFNSFSRNLNVES